MGAMTEPVVMMLLTEAVGSVLAQAPREPLAVREVPPQGRLESRPPHPEMLMV